MRHWGQRLCTVYRVRAFLCFKLREERDIFLQKPLQPECYCNNIHFSLDEFFALSLGH